MIKILLFLVIFSSLLNTYLPLPLNESAPLNQFSGGRAMRYLPHIASKPHPTGTPANAEVREYLINELKGLGLTLEVQSVLQENQVKEALNKLIPPIVRQAHHERNQPLNVRPELVEGLNQRFLKRKPNSHSQIGRIHNVLAKLPGKQAGKALLLVAHYDSVHTGPGAADNGASVAAILETLRAIKTQSALQNDVICLFTDSEENGLLGVHAFVEQHPWAKGVGLVLNFEYRGNSGAFMMFETSEGNGKLIEGLAAAVPHIQANSLMFEVYNRMPNDTDFTVFKNAGFVGMNFAAIEGFAAYHTALDRPEALNQGTLQHEGDIMLALVKHFGNQSLDNLKSENKVYFDIPGFGIVHYPVSWSRYLAGLIAVVFIVFAWLCSQAKTVRLVPVLTGFILIPTIIYGLYFFNQFTWGLIANYFVKNKPELYFDNALSYNLYLGFIVVNMALVWISMLLINKWLWHSEMAIAILAIWLSGVLFLGENGASFVLAWPLLGVLIAVILAQLPTLNNKPVVMRLLLLSGCVPAVLILVPLLKNLFVALTAGAMPILMIPVDCALYLMAIAYYLTQQRINA